MHRAPKELRKQDATLFVLHAHRKPLGISARYHSGCCDRLKDTGGEHRGGKFSGQVK